VTTEDNPRDTAVKVDSPTCPRCGSPNRQLPYPLGNHAPEGEEPILEFCADPWHEPRGRRDG
jgi:hypothetical protein